MSLRHVTHYLVLLLAAAAAACGEDGGAATPNPDGNNTPPADALPAPTRDYRNPSCVAPERPSAGINFQQVFTNLSFDRLVGLYQEPTSSARWYSVERGGFIRSFPNRLDVTAGEVEVVVNLSSVVNDGPDEAGLLGMAFHPDFANNRQVFLSYTYGDLISRFSRVTLDPDGTIDMGSEEVLLEVDQPFGNHNGGHIAFGPDGYLYIALGDGGSGGDPQGHGQNTETLLGSILRIDVDNGSPYEIPFDNPFADGNGGLPEIYAWGLRNPWRFSFDRETGALWAGDVGQNRVEEIDIIERGGNYGWNVMEGTECFESTTCDQTDLILPIAEYPHNGGDASVTGGYVYRGDEYPDLYGMYFYGDFVLGTFWAQREIDGGYETVELGEFSISPSAFAESATGELYVLDYFGSIYRVVAEAVTGENPLPGRLSETGCMQPDAPSEPLQGVLPYELALPFWSDGLEKRRFLALPEGSQITVQDNGDWELPAGAVTIKHFLREGRYVETRLFVRHPDGSYSGYTYEWLEDQSDAVLVEDRKVTDLGGQSWIYPSRGQCMGCHTDAAGRSLGLETRQLNVNVMDFETGQERNQLDILAEFGLLNRGTGRPAPYAAGNDTTASLTDRARSYMHVNCSMCHQPGGPGRGSLDLRMDTALTETRLCGEPESGDLGVSGARVVVPGNEESSTLWLRATRRDEQGMPPVASSLVDDAGAALLAEWITSLQSCP